MCISKICVDILDVFGIGIASVLIAVSMLSARQKKINFVSSKHAYFPWCPKYDNSLPEIHLVGFRLIDANVVRSLYHLRIFFNGFIFLGF